MSSGGFLVTCGDATELLEPVDAALDQISPLVGFAFSPIGERWIENAPLLVSQIAPTQCCLLQKGSLESKLDSSVKNRQHGLDHIESP
jgi:hypothetical protein